MLAFNDMRHGRLKRQIATFLYDRTKAIRLRWIRYDLLDLRHREEAFGVRNLDRLAIDNPVADHLLGATEIALRKLIMHFRDVVVDRPIFVHENAKRHFRSPYRAPCRQNSVSAARVSRKSVAFQQLGKPSRTK